MGILHQSRYSCMEYDGMRGYLRQTWFEATRRMTSMELIDESERMFRFAEHQQPMYILQDLRYFGFAMSPDQRAYLERRAREACRYRLRVAAVHSRDIFARLAVEQLMEEKVNGKGQEVKVQFFEDAEHAEKWLFSTDD